MAIAEVRIATVLDAAVVAGVHLDFWRHAYADLLPRSVLDTSDAEMTERWTARIAAGGPALLALEGGQPVGFALLAAVPDADGVGEIEAMGVPPRWQRRGHGGRLLGTAAVLLRQAGATSGRYWVPEDDPVTIAFLERAGWSPDGTRRVLDTGDGLLAERGYHGDLDLVLV